MYLKNEKGVTLMALTITIIVMLILGSVIIRSSNTHVNAQKRDKLYSDIDNLNSKINEYYMQYGSLPIFSKQYCNKEELISILNNNANSKSIELNNSNDDDKNIILNPNDGDIYYVINLENLEGLTLNYGYGSDYSSVRESEDNISTNIQDVYIINKSTHQIYYPKGIYTEDYMYYCYNLNIKDITNKLSQIESNSNLNGKIHKEKIGLIGNKEVSVKIPSRFSLSPRSGEQKIETGMVITDSEGNEYVWIPVFEKDENCTWGADYSTVKTQTEDSDEYYAAIETALKVYTKDYSDSSYKDVWYGDKDNSKYGYYDGTNFIHYTNGNMKKEEYTELYRGMLKSVYENGGFYIGRYEMGIQVVNSTAEAQQKTRTKMTEYTASTEEEGNTTIVENGAPSIEGMALPVSKANAVPYNNITQSQAQMLAENLGGELGYFQIASSLMFGVQWDAVCVFIEHFDKNNTAPENNKILWLRDNNYGKLWGNYNNSEFKLNRGYYTTSFNKDLVTWIEDYATKKGISTSWLCTTGASEQNKSLNIYDFGGNEHEWTLERYNDSATMPCVGRGNYYGNSYDAWGRYRSYSYHRSSEYCSRLALYMY